MKKTPLIKTKTYEVSNTELIIKGIFVTTIIIIAIIAMIKG